MKATFHPQAWVNDNAIDVDPIGETTWEVTPEHLDRLQAREKYPEEIFQPDTYASDRLRDDPAAPDWVKTWPLPFYVSVET